MPRLGNIYIKKRNKIIEKLDTNVLRQHVHRVSRFVHQQYYVAYTSTKCHSLPLIIIIIIIIMKIIIIIIIIKYIRKLMKRIIITVTIGNGEAKMSKLKLPVGRSDNRWNFVLYIVIVL